MKPHGTDPRTENWKRKTTERIENRHLQALMRYTGKNERTLWRSVLSVRPLGIT